MNVKAALKMIVRVSALLMVSLLSLYLPVDAQECRTFQEAWGDMYKPLPQVPELFPGQKPLNGADSLGRIVYWNEIMGNADALDHTPAASGETRVFGEQLGPARSSRAFAIVQIAVFDAVNAIAGTYQSYTGFAPAHSYPHASLPAAISQAARDTLVALYPSQAARFDTYLADDLAQIPDGQEKADGISVGSLAAAAILALRSNDGSQYTEPLIGIDFMPSGKPGKWRQDPISMNPLAYGAYWGGVKPFVLLSSSQFRASPPPDLRSIPYTVSYWEVKTLGGDGVAAPTKRTAQQTVAGIYWSCDGTPGIGTPPRAYNKIAVQIALQMRPDAAQLARLLALVNLSRPMPASRCGKQNISTSSGDPPPPSGNPTGEPAPQGQETETAGPLVIRTSLPWVHRQATSPVQTSIRLSLHTHPDMQHLERLCSRLCAESTGPTVSPLPMFPMNTTAGPGTIKGMCCRSFQGPSVPYPRQRKKTDRAGFILECTGLLTRQQVSPRAGTLPTMYAATHFCH